MVKFTTYRFAETNSDFTVEVLDCAKHLNECKAECCNNNIMLTMSEIASGLYDYDKKRPFMLKRNEDGMCVHNVKSNCEIWDFRPVVCQGYKCKLFKD